MNMAEANTEEIKTDYVSYNSIYNEVLDKVKQGLEKQRSSSSIHKKFLKKDKTTNPEDEPLFEDDDSDVSDSDDFLEWENSDNEMAYNSRFKGGLTRAKSHINELNNNNNNNENPSENNLDIIKDRIVLNKHFQKIYGFNDTSFRHGNYEIYNNDNDDSDYEENNIENINTKSSENNTFENSNTNGEQEQEQEQTPMTEGIVEGIEEKSELEPKDIDSSHNDLEKQFYNELHRASMIIDLQQHYRIRDVLKNKEDLKQEIVEGYNALHNEKYSSEDLPDFQNLENLVEVKAKMINEENNNDTIKNSSVSILEDINKATKNTEDNDNNTNLDNGKKEDIIIKKDDIKKDDMENKDDELVNDTWKFIFNNPYSLKFLSKSLKSSDEKLSTTESTSTENILTTEKSFNEKNTEDEEMKTEKETFSNSNDTNLELNNKLLSKILNKTMKNEQQLKKINEENETTRKNMENDWLSYVQKELAGIKFPSTLENKTPKNNNNNNKNKNNEYSKFIPNKIPQAPKLELAIEPNDQNQE